MLAYIIFVICIIFGLSNSDDRQKKELLTKPQVIGVRTVLDININKDTIITRNLKLETKGSKTPYQKGASDRDPDWSYQSIPKEVALHAQEFKRNMSECLKEVQAIDNRPVKRLSPKTDSPVHGECLIACVLKRNGVIRSGKINKENLIALVSKFYAKEDKLIKKLENEVDRCINISVKNNDECALASQLNECTNNIMATNKHKVTVNV